MLAVAFVLVVQFPSMFAVDEAFEKEFVARSANQ